MKGTHRHFCTPDLIEVDAASAEEIIVMLMPMQAAWYIKAIQLQEICIECHVDMRIQGFEKGGQFSQMIEIVGGEIITNETIKYNDWDWECPCPDAGG